MPYMYILECSDGSFYTGSTTDLPRRLWQHQNGLGANHTKKRLPVKLVYAEHYDRVADAFYREKQVQGWSRKKKIALMNSEWNELHILAECQNESHYQNAGFDFAQPADSFSTSSEQAGQVGQRETNNSAGQTRAERSRSPIAKTESQAIDRKE
ncbi:MAG: GIY-YIG nuclease family protein [Cyanobacteria bacterium SBLK]|nr:GIY-YIG nuclease family protein [Cyanobacteria bacterium SBLK]